MDEYTTSRECYETETEIIVIGGVAHDDESHNCDEMGCGSASPHVKYRIKKSELASLRARDDGRVELIDLIRELYDEDACVYDHNDYCQTHYYNRPCAHERARAVLAAADRREP